MILNTQGLSNMNYSKRLMAIYSLIAFLIIYFISVVLFFKRVITHEMLVTAILYYSLIYIFIIFTNFMSTEKGNKDETNTGTSEQDSD